ncbi:hypothetical protein GCM10017556_40030 [Micromonospora sagamiensis]|nr:hypothetical protein GCM10017556_40030 [Micromonospora sagamiensis]
MTNSKALMLTVIRIPAPAPAPHKSLTPCTPITMRLLLCAQLRHTMPMAWHRWSQ